ncbi:DMT family transporter [Marinicrinis sediminis]|uniref:DMT family transporter n=1 Tax=Marinicrinis sediminis TaxID=1652465 RepID=A0ABW5RE68_9BACL
MKVVYFILLLATSMLWAGNFVAGKFTVGHADPLMMSFLRYVIAVAVLFPLVRWKERKFWPSRSSLLPLIGMGATGIFLFNLFMFQALQHTSAINTGIISALNPLAIALMTFIFTGQRLNGKQRLGMLTGLIGVVIVITRGKVDQLFALSFNMGDLYMVAAVLTWGVYSVLTKFTLKDEVGPLFATFWAGLFGLGLMLPFIWGEMTISSPDTSFWIALLYIGIGATVLAMLFWNIGVQKVGGTQSGMFLNFNPVFTALFAYIWIGESLTWPQAAGTMVVIAGVWLYTLGNIEKVNRSSETPASP